MKPRLLVVTAVHPSDDPRIREKLAGTLAADFDVRLASPPPGPSDPSGLVWVPLIGPRWRRNLRALVLCLRDPGDVVSFHDPEMLHAAILTRLLRRKAVVFDVHENVPEQIQTKSWLPARLRPVIAAAARASLRIAERIVEITLAEWGYAGLFRHEHPVFPNYPLRGALPDPAAAPGQEIVYLGDVTVQRGAETTVEAVGALDAAPRLVMIGRCNPELAARLTQRASELGVSLELTGWQAHRAALDRVATARLALSPLHDIPNYRFSMPTKVLEYLALGVPVVASDLPGTREVVHENGGVRFAVPGDVASLTSAIAAALADEAQLGAARVGAADIRERFTWPTDEVRSFYTSLVTARGS